MIVPSMMSRRTADLRAVVAVMGLVWTLLPSAILVGGAGAEEGQPPNKIFRTCGACPAGFATTGISVDAVTCPDDDHQLVQCIPLGVTMLSVCGDCPEGYHSVGSSNMPSRCGKTNDGRLSQCQAEKAEAGGVRCPPNCTTDTLPAVPGKPRILSEEKK